MEGEATKVPRVSTEEDEAAGGGLERLVVELGRIEGQRGLARTLAVGELILNQFFGGDPAAWHDRRRNKSHSIRRLAALPNCPFCKSVLNEAVGVYVAIRGLHRVRTFGHVTASHVTSVLSLGAEDQLRLLEEAERAGWSVRTLRRNVRALQRPVGENREARAHEYEALALGGLRSKVKALQEAVARVRGLEPLSREARRELSEIGDDVARLGCQLVSTEQDPADAPMAAGEPGERSA